MDPEKSWERVAVGKAGQYLQSLLSEECVFVSLGKQRQPQGELFSPLTCCDQMGPMSVQDLQPWDR